MKEAQPMRPPDVSVLGRIAGAPISWGVCEVPGWGVMLPPERVLSDMHELGLAASELGPHGYLGDGPEEVAQVLSRHSLGAVGGFVPLVLHDIDAHRATLAGAEQAARLIQGAGGTYFVTAAVFDAGWSAPLSLDASQWDQLVAALGEVDRICKDHGLSQVLHPHAGTVVEQAADVARLAERSPVSWCLDTGHLAIGGVDPVAFASEHAERVGLVHLKDVDLSLARAVREHDRTLVDATRAGLFQALGRGGVDVAGVVDALEARRYRGWYVLEQDIAIDPAAAASVDPSADVRASIDYLAAAVGAGGR